MEVNLRFLCRLLRNSYSAFFFQLFDLLGRQPSGTSIYQVSNGQSLEKLAHSLLHRTPNLKDQTEILYHSETITTIGTCRRRLVTSAQGLGTYDLHTAAVFEIQRAGPLIWRKDYFISPCWRLTVARRTGPYQHSSKRVYLLSCTLSIIRTLKG